MKTAGIICEYNPFHNGHAHHIAETRRILGGNAGIVCVMSGSFTQRGTPAVFRKHTRAAAAVRCGADVVFELPLPWALSSAERFAMGGVSLLNMLGVVTHLSFGSECGNIEALRKCASAAASEEGDELTRSALKSGVSYAFARAEAMERLGADRSVFSNPNDTLAVEYIKSAAALNSCMELIAVPRIGAGHGDAAAGNYASGSYLREVLFSGGDISPFVPAEALTLFETEISSGRAPVRPNALDTAVMARLRSMKESDFSALPDATEGLDRRFCRAAAEAPDIESFLFTVKTKRYTLSRIRRMLAASFLGVTAEDLKGAPPYARVLAANGRGRELLAEIREKGRAPVLTKPASVRMLGERARYIFEKEAHASDLAALACPNIGERRGGQDWRTSPVML